MDQDAATRRWLERARASWDARAPYFDEFSIRNALADDRQVELDRVARLLGLRPGSRVLDAGCGPGHFAIAFAQLGCIVDGVDISPEMIARARQHATEAGLTISFSTGDLASLDAPDAAYDAIVSRVALQFSPDVSAALDEFERVGNADAMLWLAVPGSLSAVYRHSWRRFLPGEPEQVNHIVPWELIQLLSERGWHVIEQWGSYDDPVGADAHNTAADLDIESLPLQLRQAAATVWNVIATRGS